MRRFHGWAGVCLAVWLWCFSLTVAAQTVDSGNVAAPALPTASASEPEKPALPQAARNLAPKWALVIGNAQYEGGGHRVLKNPANDARLIGQTLASLGFEVQTHLNLPREQMAERVQAFAGALPAGATALVFYAGHGVQLAGANYLIPVDVRAGSEQSVRIQAYPLRSLLEALSASPSAVNIVVLDACRDNPFQPAPPVRYRSNGPMGLAKVQTPRGTVIAYSTSPGQLAADGPGTHSVYAQALSKTLLQSGLTLEEVFKRVNTLVRNATRDEQTPWYESSITQEYFFLPPAGVQVLADTRAATSPRNATSKNKRGEGQKSGPEPRLWYLKMNDYEWSELDWQLQQRVRNLTEDEIPELTQRADAGNVMAMTTLGMLYSEGVSKVRDLRTGRWVRANPNNTLARHWLQRASDQDFPIAQTLLAESFFEAGRLNEAKALLQKAVRANYPRAKLDLAQTTSQQNGAADLSLYLQALQSVMRSAQVPTPAPNLPDFLKPAPNTPAQTPPAPTKPSQTKPTQK